MTPRPQWPYAVGGLALAALLTAGVYSIGEWNVFAYAAGVTTGGMIAAAGMIAEQYNKRSSGQRPR